MLGDLPKRTRAYKQRVKRVAAPRVSQHRRDPCSAKVCSMIFICSEPAFHQIKIIFERQTAAECKCTGMIRYRGGWDKFNRKFYEAIAPILFPVTSFILYVCVINSIWSVRLLNAVLLSVIMPVTLTLIALLIRL